MNIFAIINKIKQNNLTALSIGASKPTI